MCINWTEIFTQDPYKIGPFRNSDFIVIMATFGKETFTTKSYAAMTAGAPLVPLDIPRRKPEAGDVHIAIKCT